MASARRTYCRICEAACGLVYEERPDGRARLRPDREHPVSRGFVCAKGTRFAEVAGHPSRVTAPRLRPARRAVAMDGADADADGAGAGADGADGEPWAPASWGAAIEAAAARLRRVVERHGPHAVGMYIGNPLAFHAAGQVAAVFFARALGTRNVFSAGSQDCNNKFAAAQILHGSPVLQPIPDFEHAEAAILFGTNPAVSQSSFVHLEGGATVFDRMQARGAHITWVDVRRTESARRWGELVRVRPGTDVWLLLGLLGLWADRAPRGDARVEGLEALLGLAREVTPRRAAERTGVPEETVRRLAAQLERPTALHLSVGVNQGPFGTLSYVAMQALAYCSGNYDARGGSLFSPLAVGGARLARRVGLFTSPARSRIGDFPTVFDTLPGGVLADEILEPGPERIRAMVVVAGDPIRSIPGSTRLAEAFASLDTLVCLDLFESETAAHADVFLPCTSWLERADIPLPSLPLQTADLLQSTAAVRAPLGASRPEHEILAALSLAMGRPLFGSRLAARAVSRRGLVDRALPMVTRALAAALGGAARARYGVPVPAPQPGTYLGRGPMTPGARVRFWDPQLAREAERLRTWRPAEAEFLLLGRRRRIGHNSWLHGGVRDGRPEAEAWLHPDDLARLGVASGGDVRLRTAGGALVLPARADEGVSPGTVVVPHGEWSANVNRLLPAGAAQVEPTSGNLHMTGIPVEVDRAEPLPPAPDAPRPADVE